MTSGRIAWEGRLGVPYQGSKNSIAREIVSILPGGLRFVDLFAGGCAMTHAALVSGRYGSFLANDIQGDGVRLFMDAVSGKCSGRENEWISRSEFSEKAGADPFVALCWSFGNNRTAYLYGREIESVKKWVHFEYAARGRYQEWMRGRSSTDSLPSYERSRAVARLGGLSGEIGRIATTFSSYESYDHDEGDVVFCDPPYAGTAGYAGADGFDHKRFWEWVDGRQYPVFVSEYSAPDGFTPIWTKGKQKNMGPGARQDHAAEFVFVASRYAPMYQTDLFLGM